MEKIIVKCDLKEIVNVCVEFETKKEIIDTFLNYGIIKSPEVNSEMFGEHDSEKSVFPAPNSMLATLMEIGVNIEANSWLN